MHASVSKEPKAALYFGIRGFLILLSFVIFLFASYCFYFWNEHFGMEL